MFAKTLQTGSTSHKLRHQADGHVPSTLKGMHAEEISKLFLSQSGEVCSMVTQRETAALVERKHGT